MSLLLAFLGAMVLIGFTTNRLSGRLYLLMSVLAVCVTCLYYFTHRFMT